MEASEEARVLYHKFLNLVNQEIELPTNFGGISKIRLAKNIATLSIDLQIDELIGMQRDIAVISCSAEEVEMGREIMYNTNTRIERLHQIKEELNKL